MDILITIVAFLAVLSVLVIIHEFGHFITAKRLGIKVEEFGFGFPPRVFGIKIGETLYSLNLLPIGGFVKLYGEDAAGGGSVKQSGHMSHVEGQMLHRAFFARPIWQRATIVLAGVVMNFILAVVLISYLFSARGVALPTNNIKVVEVVHLSPAEKAGLMTGDEVLTVDGRGIKDTSEFINFTHSQLGIPVTLQVKRGTKELTLQITPRKTYPKGEGPMGVAISSIEIKKYPWYKAPFYGTLEAFKFSWLILSGLGGMIFQLATTGQKPEGVTGPVGVAALTGQAVSYGVDATLWFVSILSLNLAVVNVLPIPALDGGRLFFILIEAVTRKKVNAKYEALAHAIGLAVLLGLILLITFFDVARLISGQSLLPKM